MQESIKARLAAAKQQQQAATGTTTTTAATTTTTTTTLPLASGTTTSGTISAAEQAARVQSIQARLQAVKAQQQQARAEETPTNASRTAGAADSRPTKRAKHFDLDLSVTGPTFKTTTQAAVAAIAPPAAPPKKINPYLAHQASATEDDGTSAAGPDDTTAFEGQDDRLARASKSRTRHKAMRFVEPGHFQKIAEIKREKIAKAQQSGFLSGRKAGHSVHAAGMADIYGAASASSVAAEETVESLAPRWDAHPDTKMPLAVEWWDVELLPSKIKKKVAAAEAKALSKQSKEALQSLDTPDEKDSSLDEGETPPEDLRSLCLANAKLSHSKTSELVQHIVPVKPLNADTMPAKEAVLHLTKKERRRQRKLRRREKQREQQDLQAAGLIPAPEPRLTLQNFIRVLGDQAFVDPSQMEKKVMEQVEARKQAHLDRNEANKLTKEQRAAKRAKKLEEDTTQGVHVAVFYVKDMSHPYHRAKVDLNAQQYNITGGVVESARDPPMACVVCEGGPKAIKKYTRLMTVRMKWTGPSDGDDSEDEDGDKNEEMATHKFNPDNTCALVWEGMITKRAFSGFVFQSCESPEQARRVLKSKGVPHYWDLVAAQAGGLSSKLGLKLAEDSDDENPFAQAAEADDGIVMRDD
jgi:U4/U6 small nuclear ribonucleoprotein PRP3